MKSSVGVNLGGCRGGYTAALVRHSPSQLSSISLVSRCAGSSVTAGLLHQWRFRARSNVRDGSLSAAALVIMS